MSALAELVLLERFDTFRAGRGHDYGGGQRATELGRRRRELRRWDRLGHEPLSSTVAAGVVSLDELVAAWERIARPRRKRAELARATASTRRTRAAWDELEAELAVARRRFASPVDMLRHHVTGAVERGEADPIVEVAP